MYVCQFVRLLFCGNLFFWLRILPTIFKLINDHCVTESGHCRQWQCNNVTRNNSSSYSTRLTATRYCSCNKFLFCQCAIRNKPYAHIHSFSLNSIFLLFAYRLLRQLLLLSCTLIFDRRTSKHRPFITLCSGNKRQSKSNLKKTLTNKK